MNVNIDKIQDFSFIFPLCFSPSPKLQDYRSTKGIKRLSSSERALIKLPDEVKEVLIGILLGDGFVVRVVLFITLYFILNITI